MNLKAYILPLCLMISVSVAQSASRVGDDNIPDQIEIQKVPVDTVVHPANDTVGQQSAEKRNIFQKIGDYFSKSNQFNPNKKMDFGIIGGPHYSSTTGLGLGLVASGLYRLDKSDQSLPLSNLSLFGDVSTSGFLMIGLRGNNVLPKRKYRFDYSIYVYTFPTKFWGVGYDNGNIDDNESHYSRFKFEVKPRFLFRLAKNTYFGPLVDVQYVKAHDFDAEGLSLLGPNPEMCFTTIGGGFSFTYDSRDIIHNATRGWFVQLDQLFNSSFFGNKHEFHSTDLTVATYHKVWKGAVIAGELHSMFNFNDVPWQMLANVGSPNRMRGYFEGRYRDKNIVEAQVEIRQHIWKRNGAVVWFGAANVFPEFDAIRFRKTLLNGGVGYRWAFKQGVNVRLDLGFTKNGMGFTFNINEAF